MSGRKLGVVDLAGKRSMLTFAPMRISLSMSAVNM